MMCDYSVFKNACVHRKTEQHRLHAIIFSWDPGINMCPAVVKHHVKYFGSDWLMHFFSPIHPQKIHHL